MLFDQESWGLIRDLEPGDLAIVLRLVARELGLEPASQSKGEPVPPLCQLAGDFLARKSREMEEVHSYGARLREQNIARAQKAVRTRWAKKGPHAEGYN